MGESLDQELTVEEVIAGPGSRWDHNQSALLRQFWFEAATHRARIGPFREANNDDFSYWRFSPRNRVLL